MTFRYPAHARRIEAAFDAPIATGIAHRQLDGGQTGMGRTFVSEGKTFVNFSSCSYLGLGTDPRASQGAADAALQYGPCFSMSRAYCSSPGYERFQEQMEEMVGHPCVITTSTSLGSLSVMQTFINDRDLILLDEYVHNSVKLAATTTLRSRTEIRRVPHNDMDALRAILQAEGMTPRNIWYCADGLYSMHGDFLPLDELLELMDTYPNLHAYVDDAHGMSAHGKHGRGFVLGQQERLHPRMIVALSLAKGFGMGLGGVMVLPDKEAQRMLRTCGPTLIFSGPIPPPMLGAGNTLAGIHLSDELPELQQALYDRIAHFRARLAEAGMPSLADPRSPVQFVEIGPEEHTVTLLETGLEHGYFFNIAAYPAVAKGRSGLRMTINNRLTYADLDGLVEALVEGRAKIAAEPTLPAPPASDTPSVSV